LTRKKVKDLRTAAYVVAIKRVADAYMELGFSRNETSRTCEA
jgi:glutamate dehydrogenase/leucine dehydrogenase